MKRYLCKALSLVLALTLCLGLFAPVIAAENVTPTAPEWIGEKYYVTFPGDKVYEPEYWTRIEALRESARNGAVSLPDGYKDLFNYSSTGIRYEIGLVQLKYAENAGVETEEGRLAFREAGISFGFAASSVTGIVVRMRLARDRAMMLYDYAYEENWADTLVPTLDVLGMTGEDVFDAPYMDLISKDKQAKVIADIAAYREEEKAKAEAIQVWLDGGRLNMDTIPEARNGRTMVPIRVVAEALGGTVEWVQDTQQVVMTRAGVTVTMTLNSTTATIDDRIVEMDVAPYATNGRTLIPARYVAEFFGQKVDWDGEKRRVLITEDKSVVGDSNLEAWALPMGAMLTYISGGTGSSPARFGLYTRGGNAAERCHSNLDGASWNIPDRNALAYTVLSMTFYGHDSTFREMAEDVKTHSQEERAAISAASDAWPAYMWEYTEYVDEKWGDRGIMAWDLFRMSNLVQWGYTAGYVTYAEALELLEPAATILCESFSSWDEAYENYLDGYNWWARNDVLGKDIWETSRGQRYLSMKANPRFAGIFDDTLFETGVIGLPEP